MFASKTSIWCWIDDNVGLLTHILSSTLGSQCNLCYKVTLCCVIMLLPLFLQPILTRLRALFDLIIMFQQKQVTMFSECLQEVETRTSVEISKEKRAEEVRRMEGGRDERREDGCTVCV